MGKYFDVNGTAMVYISIDHTKSKDDANLYIAKACQTIKKSFKNNLQKPTQPRSLPISIGRGIGE